MGGGTTMKITKKQIRQLINEQYAAIARGGSSPMKSRATREFAHAIKTGMYEGIPEGMGDSLIGPQDRQDSIDDMTMELINLFHQTSFVDLDINDLAAAVFNALSYNNLYSRDQVLQALGKVIYSQDSPRRLR